jgi:hypothetical protein
MANKIGVVVTTINHPTHAVKEIAKRSQDHGWKFILIGDTKSPPDFEISGATYLDIRAQQELPFKFSKICPTRHYARKNIGYLEAIASGAEVIVETDDDNIPLDGFWLERDVLVDGDFVSADTWVNVYRFFADGLIWPRGLPLELIQLQTELVVERTGLFTCPIQQGLANGNPDVDAVYRLVMPLPLNFNERAPVVLDKGSWCPFNSQNTSWWPEAYPLLYLPFHCSFRMTDIWRSFVAQRIAWENNWYVSFHNATVFQERNEHNLLKDFEDEIPGYLNNNEIVSTLMALKLDPGSEHMGRNLRACYDALIGRGWIGQDERALLNAWIDDVESIRH